MQEGIPLSRKTGIILLVALVVFAVMSVLTIAIAGIGLTDLTETQNTEVRTRAHYLALSGIEIGRGVLENLASRNLRGIIYGKLDTENPSAGSLTFSDCSALGSDFSYHNLKAFLTNMELGESDNLIIGVAQDSENKIKIVSLGCEKDIRKSITLILKPVGVFSAAIFGMESVDVSGQGSVSGKIGTNSVDTGALYIGSNTTVDGTICVVDIDNNSHVVTNYETLTTTSVATEALLEELSYPIPGFPDLSTTSPMTVANAEQKIISADSGYDVIDIAPNGELVLDTSESPDLVISCVDLKSLGKITVWGNGTVWLYVSGDINLDDITADDGTIILVYSGTSQISMTSQIVAHSFGIYAPNADVDLGGQIDLKGAVIARTAKISGSSDIGYSFFTYDEDFNYLSFPITSIGSTSGRYTEEWSE